MSDKSKRSITNYNTNFLIVEPKPKEAKFNISRGAFGVSLICLVCGFIAVLFNRDFSLFYFLNALDNNPVVSYNIYDVLTAVRNFLPDGIGFFDALEDIACFAVLIAYALSWCISFVLLLLFGA